MKVYLKPGGQEVNLTQKNFLAQGGQGSVYVQGQRAFKIYHDPAAMIPTGKIAALSHIRNPRVIKPDHVLTDSKGQVVGYDMRFIDNAWTLCQTFPKVFRTRNNLTEDKVGRLVLNLRSMVEDIHQAKVLIVDLNETNMLVSQDFSEVYGIDADSYQVVGYPATVIMPSVRDPKVKHNLFTELSDWFSFGVVAFQMLIGIHPYKGTHPDFHGVTSLQDRMAAGISVFNPKVGVPKATMPFDVIPKSYRKWFEAVFEGGERSPPPLDFAAVAQVVVPVFQTVTGRSNLEYAFLRQYPEPVIGHWYSLGSTMVATADGSVYRNHLRVATGRTGRMVGVAFSPKANKPVLAHLDGGTLHLFDVDANAPLPLPLAVDQAMHCEGRIYVKVGPGIYEVYLTEIGTTKIIPAARQVSNCMEQATTLYEGCAIQSLLGKIHVTLFPGSGLSATLPLPALDVYGKIVDARCVRNVLMVVAEKNGVYDRLVFCFNTERNQYETRVVNDITPTGLNFTVLDTKIGACLAESGKLELFTVVVGGVVVKTIDDKDLDGDMVLSKEDGKVVFYRGNQLHGMKTK